MSKVPYDSGVVKIFSIVKGYVTSTINNALTTINSAVSGKVDKISGKGLSEADFTTAEKNKLSGIAAGAEANVNADWSANSGDAQILNKPDLTVYALTDEMTTALGGKVDKETGKSLMTADEHTKLSGIETGAQVNTVTGVKGNAEANYRTGEINISPANIGLGNVDNTSDANKPISTATQTALDGKVDKETGKVLTDINYSSTEKAKVDGAIQSTEKGSSGGVAELDANGKVPSSQMPSSVDNILEYPTLNDFPATGEDHKIYIALDTRLTYRWGGSEYAEISPSIALGETSSTAYRGDWGKATKDAVGNIQTLQTADKSNLVAAINELKSTSVSADPDKGLSSNDFTTALKNKLDGIESGAEVNVQSDWNQTVTTADDFIKNKPENLVQDASYVHTDNNYTTAEKTKLGGIETGAKANVQSDWNQSDTTADDFIKNKPTNATASAAGLMSATDKEKLDGQGEVLYSDVWNTASGTSLILDKSINDYTVVNILFSCTLASNIHSSVEISESRKTVLSITDIASTSNINIYSAILIISQNGTTISTERAMQAVISSSGSNLSFTVTNKLTDSSSSSGYINIYKIVGYK